MQKRPAAEERLDRDFVVQANCLGFRFQDSTVDSSGRAR
jgi:hypothetical protein